MKLFIAAGLFVALAASPTTSAQADVIYSFTQTTPTLRSASAGADQSPSLATITSFDLVVTDEAARNGFTAYSINNGHDADTSRKLEGVVGLSLNIFNAPTRISTLSFTLADFTRPVVGSIFERFLLDVSATANGLLTGRVRYDGFFEQDWLTFNGTSSVLGRFGSDATGACTVDNQQPGCTFSGVQTTVTTVPEPMSIALFGAGLAGLAISRRRKA